MESGQDILIGRTCADMAGKVVQEAEHLAEAQGNVSMDDAGRMTQEALNGVSDIGRWGASWGDRQWEREF